MNEQSRLVSSLVMNKANEQHLEAERRKLRQFELLRFKEFRRSMMERLRKKDKSRTAAVQVGWVLKKKIVLGTTTSRYICGMKRNPIKIHQVNFLL